MSTPLAPTTLRLERGQTTRLTGPRPAHLTSAAGTLWVTIDNDPRDIVLEPGEAIALRGDAPVLVSPLGGPAVLRLTSPGRPAAMAPQAGAARAAAQPLRLAGARLAGAAR